MPRRKTPRAQAGIWELMLLPVLMGGLSLLMWFSLPTSKELLDEFADEIEARKRDYARVVGDLPSHGRANSAGCPSTLNPLPVRQADDALTTNTEFVHATDLDKIGISSPLRSGEQFYLRGRLTLLIYWRIEPFIGPGQRSGRDRVDEDFHRPLATRYVVMYGTEILPGATPALRVDAFLYDLRSAERLCELALVEWIAGESDSYNVRPVFLERLAAVTGGTFTAD